MVADTAKGLQKVLDDLERYAKENGMEVNTQKTKVMVYRNGGKLRKEDKWKYKGEELEVVKEYKYLGYWFNSRERNESHIKRLQEKARKAVNATWGIIKRARVNTLKRRMLLMNAVAKAGALYGVEVWGWNKWIQIERIKGRILKMPMGLNTNTRTIRTRITFGGRKLG